MQRTVLVVDDDYCNRDVVRICLQQQGYRVVEAGDGLEALARVLQDPPDLVLLDLMMPLLDGWETMAALQADPATRDIPVVAYTAVDRGGLAERLRAAGFTSCLCKPVSLRQLRQTIEDCLALRRRGGRWLEPLPAELPAPVR